MYTLRFHFVGGGYYDEKITDERITREDMGKEKVRLMADIMMKQDYVKGEYAMVNLHNVTMIEIIEQED